MPEPGAPTLPGVIAAFLRRDLAVASGYRTAFLLRSISIVVALASLAYLASFVDAGGGAIHPRYGRSGYLGFFLVGLAVGEVFHAVALSLSNPIREAQLSGTLEAMLSTPAPAPYVLLGVASSTLAFALLRLVLYFGGAALLFDLSLGPVHAGSLLLVAFLSLLAFAAIAILGGALTMRLRRTDPMSLLIGTTAGLIGGVLFPVDLLPWPLDRAAYALPLAPAIEGIRRAVFAGAAPGALGRELVALGAFVLIAAPAAVLAFVHALRRAREDGSLGQY